MNLVPSLLQAIVRIDGEVLVMHPGDKPYVVSPAGQVELATKPLTFDAVNGIVLQLLPLEVQNALDDVGAVQYTLPVQADFPGDKFTVIVARGTSDVWAEIRRRRLDEIDRTQAIPGRSERATVMEGRTKLPPVSNRGPHDALDVTEAAHMFARRPADLPPLPVAKIERHPASSEVVGPTSLPEPLVVATDGEAPEMAGQDGAEDIQESSTGRAPRHDEADAEPTSAVVLQMSRSPIRAEAPAASASDTLSGLERLLRTAAARGASALYVSSDARPSVRVDGQLQTIDNESVYSASDVESLLLALMPGQTHESFRKGASTEWICELEDLGRVRCMSFNDHRGPGGVFRLMPARVVTVEQLALTREVQSLAIEPEGLVLVTGSRSSGKHTLISALVDLINRVRRDHVITIEREVYVVHERNSSFVSQREVRGGDDEVLAAARAALREDPDVLVVEQIRDPLVMNLALEAAASGHLVIAGFSAHNATETIDRILELYAPEHARQVQVALADNLRGVIAQVLVPKVGGGRVAAREVLLNTPAVASVIAGGKTSQLPMAIEGGRRVGMAPLSDALASYVQNGTVDIREACRFVPDRAAFVAMLKRQGVDTSAVERFA